MFVTKDELKNVIYSYQLDQITLDDETLVTIAVETAIDEIKSYLSHRYDMKKAFQAQGSDRSPLLLQMTKVLALHKIVQISNVDIVYQHVQEDYDRWVKFLTGVANGKLNPDLPPLNTEGDTSSSIVEWGSDTKLENNY